MENKLNKLFDYQKFAKNGRLEAIIAETEARYSEAISDDDLELVSAAGEFFKENSETEKADS